LGAIMLSVASTLSRVFYHSRTMAIGIILYGSFSGSVVIKPSFLKL
jgi:hypothetical protein